MKTKSLFFSIVTAAFLSSSIPYGSHSLEIGSEAPAITLSSSSKASLDGVKDCKVLVNFWSASDPSSRIANSMMSEAAESGNIPGMRFITICIDPDASLANEIMKADGISGKVIALSSSEVSDDVLKDYQISKGCRAFVIDSFGNLESVASSAEISTLI